MDYENEVPQEQNDFPWNYDMPPLSPPPKKKKTVSAGKVIALAISFGLFGGALGAAGVHWLMHSVQPENPSIESSQILEGSRPEVQLDTVLVETGVLLSPAQVYANNVDATVGITTSVTTNFWGYQTTSAASGSGFILSSDGYILTNFHVVENSNSITVSLYDGATYDAQLIGYDESNDIAVLKVEAQGLRPVILGDSDKMFVGDSVVAIGNPLGELTFSLTAGTVSALDRQVTMSTGVTMNLIQTDCAINSGNSGGALFNLYGEVVGITNAKYSSSSSGASIDNIGFAIPINDVRQIVESIIEKGYFAKPYLGISVVDVSAESQSFGLPQGAAIKAVSENSPAAAAGLQAQDIITHMDGVAVTGSSDLVQRISDLAPGDTVTLTVYRQGQTLQLTATIGEQIQSALEQKQTTNSSQGYSPFPFGK